MTTLNQSTTTSSPKEFTIYLPKKARNSAIVDLGPGLDFNMIKEIAPDKYYDMIQKFKEDAPEGMVFVDVYKNNIVYFECHKAIEAIKKYTLDNNGIDICIKKIVIADIPSIQANSYDQKYLHEPCHLFQNYDDYPTTYTFDNPI